MCGVGHVVWEVMAIYFHHSCLKCEWIYSNGNKRIQELVVDIVTVTLIMIGTTTFPGPGPDKFSEI